VSRIQNAVDTVTFSTRQRSYMRSSVETIKLLHYISLDGASTSSDPSSPNGSLSYLDSAEIVVFYDEQDPQATGDVSGTILHCMHPMPPSLFGH
jgi:hypothetical protein